MKLAFALLLFLSLGTTLLAQEVSKRAAIEGLVTRDPDGQAVKKALIELIAQNQSEAGNYTAVTGPDGKFHIDNIVPGRYHLFAERTGLLDTDKQRGHTDGRILTLAPGEVVSDLHLRLQAAAVLRGRVTDEDGDPLPGAEVTVLRETFVAGRRHWEQAGAERTNDLGEYRIANLAAGNAQIVVNPPPDFKSLIENAGTAARDARGVNASEKPAPATYQTTYYPGTSDRSQAMPIQLHPGDEIPANFSLTPSPSRSIRGVVVNVPPRASASIMLQSRDFSLILNGAEMHKDGSFVIHDVSPGSYTIVATIEGSSVPMMARQALEVGPTNIEELRLSPQPGANVQARVHLEGGNPARFDPARIFLALQSVEPEQDETLVAARETFSNLAHLAPDGSFQWTDVPAGNYYVQLMGNADTHHSWFLKSVLADGRDVNDPGVTLSGGTASLDLVISTNGGVVDGVAVNGKGQPFANAVVVAVPESRLRTRTDQYRKTVTDQNGRFTLRGIRPGDYTFFAWESVEGDAYYNPDFLKTYEGQGSALHVAEGEQKSLHLDVIPAADLSD
jgi:hypothetical protein